VGTTTVSVPVSVGSRPAIIADFESAGPWTAVATPAGAAAAVSVVPDGRVGKGLRLSYTLPAGARTRAAYARVSQLIGDPLSLSVDVRGDGQGARLRARIRDTRGQEALVDLAPSVDWSGDWRRVEGAIPQGLAAPLKLDALYVVETDATVARKGALVFDNLTAHLPP
jgi:hypothetical protein